LFGVGPSTVDLCWSLAAQDAQSLVLNGKYAPWEKILEDSLRRAVLMTLLPFSAPSVVKSAEFEYHIKDVMNAVGELDLKRGAKEALEEWRRNGWKIYLFSNGSEESLQKLIVKDDLTSLVDGILSCQSSKLIDHSLLTLHVNS
jgi:FMN phosphatase YigB (HAD superfamily)